MFPMRQHCVSFKLRSEALCKRHRILASSVLMLANPIAMPYRMQRMATRIVSRLPEICMLPCGMRSSSAAWRRASGSSYGERTRGKFVAATERGLRTRSKITFGKGESIPIPCRKSCNFMKLRYYIIGSPVCKRYGSVCNSKGTYEMKQALSYDDRSEQFEKPRMIHHGIRY